MTAPLVFKAAAVFPYVGMIQIRSQVRAMQPTLSPLCADSLFSGIKHTTVARRMQACAAAPLRCAGLFSFAGSCVRMGAGEVTDMKQTRTRALFATFFKIGAFTFGGGYAMVALLEHEFVEEKQWVTREEFLDMVAIAESTPGPVAVNSATYIGYKLEGVPGAAASTLAVCLPSFAVIYAISLFFDQFLQLSVVSSAFRGIQVCVVYLVLSAGLKVLKNLKKDAFSRAVLAAVLLAMVSCSVLAVSFSSIFYILLSGAAGLAVYGVQQLRKEAGAK